MVRSGNWWMQKIPPLLLVAYVVLIEGHGSVSISLMVIGALMFCLSCVAAYGHVINDWFDIAEDERAGKPNTMRNIPLARRILLCLSLLAAPFLLLAFFPGAWLARAALAANFLWPTLYSIPQVRLKERGVLGVLSDAAGSHITPTLFAFALASFYLPVTANVLVCAAIVLWATTLGIKGIVYHQILDRASDAIAGVATYAATWDFTKLSTALTRFNLLIELPISVCLVTVVAAFFPLAAVALAFYLALEVTKYLLGFEFALGAEAQLRRPSVPFANEMFYTLWLPVAASVQLAVANAWLFWLPVVHCFLFRDQVWSQVRDAQAVFSQLKLRYAHSRPRN